MQSESYSRSEREREREGGGGEREGESVCVYVCNGDFVCTYYNIVYIAAVVLY